MVDAEFNCELPFVQELLLPCEVLQCESEVDDSHRVMDIEKSMVDDRILLLETTADRELAADLFDLRESKLLAKDIKHALKLC